LWLRARLAYGSTAAVFSDTGNPLCAVPRVAWEKTVENRLDGGEIRIMGRVLTSAFATTAYTF